MSEPYVNPDRRDDASQHAAPCEGRSHLSADPKLSTENYGQAGKLKLVHLSQLYMQFGHPVIC